MRRCQRQYDIVKQRARTYPAVMALGAILAACGGGVSETKDQEMYIAATDDGERVRVEAGDSLQQLTWSPDSSRFAYFSEDPRDGPGELHIVDPSTPDDIADFPVPSSPHRITWSPSGEKLAVVYFAGAGPVVALAQLDGSDLTTVVKLPPAQGFRDLIWLNEDRVLVEESGTQGPVLVSYDVVSGKRFQHAGAPGFPDPVLSPDRTKLAWGVYCSRDSIPGIWVLDVMTEYVKQVDKVCGQLTDLAWSPDGTEIAYTAWYTATDYGSDIHSDTTGGLYVVNLGSGETRRVTDPGPGGGAFGEAVEVGVEWDSDGSGFRVRRDHSYNCSDCGGSPELVVVSEDGSEQTPITEGQVQTVGGDAIAYTNDDGFIISSFDGGDAKVVLKQNDEWRFRLAEFSPDGQWIAFTRFHCGECEFP